MKVLAFNGSPRKKWNTAQLLEKALEGAKSEGANVELINLYDLNYKGCTSCFACKTKDSKNYGHCAVQDELTPILKRIQNVEAIILGSPIYFGTVTGEIRSFMERLMFPYLEYTLPPQSLFPRKIKSGFIYTMNISKEDIKEYGYNVHFNTNQRVLEVLFGHCESIFSYDTYQFKDYSKVVCDRFDPAKKEKQRETIFPKDLENAFELGVRLTK